jgi:hypothetical protein
MVRWMNRPLGDYWMEQIEERAAICEYDGKMTRAAAWAFAVKDIEEIRRKRKERENDEAQVQGEGHHR